MAARPGSPKPFTTQPELPDEEILTHDSQAGKQSEPEFLKTLEVLTVPELNQVLQRAHDLRANKLDSAKQDFMTRIRAESEQLGLNLGTLFGGAAPAKRGRKPASEPKAERPPVLPKYRSPAGHEWSGRGRMPRWLQAEEAEGKSREEFLIDKVA